jgi:alkaline phosphatase D
MPTPTCPSTHPLREAAEVAGAHDTGRRHFMRGLTLDAGAAGVLPLVACGGGGDDPAGPAPRFDHGVASGDPLSDRVMLWTRVTPPEGSGASITVQWAVASDAAFASVVAQGTATAVDTADHTVKVDATGLAPATAYFYRFVSGGVTSATGRTRTLPTGSVAQVRLAVLSCASYPTGYFNAYAHAAQRGDLDATVHLGDYLYEYAQGGYASDNAAALGRQPSPVTEALSLADYRLRHAQYKTDADLQALHAAAPMIAVWDDHEIANDTWTGGAENHSAATEGDFALRKAAALKAYHEWMPTRNAQPDVLYRSFAFGNLLALHMLDTRVVGREQPLDYAAYFTATGLDAARFTTDLTRADHQLLGAPQTTWLQGQLAASTATWQVLGQQVLMGRMNIPAPILAEANNPGTGVTVSQYAVVAAKAQAAPATLTATEQALLAQPSIPYNLDAWDGYFAARETVLATARTLGRNLVVLSGDTHNAWANELQDLNRNPAGVEFATASVSSPGFEAYLPNENPTVLAGALQALIPSLKYCDTARRGYLLLTATATECRADWVFVSTIAQKAYTATTAKSLKVLAGAAHVGKIVAA